MRELLSYNPLFKDSKYVEKQGAPNNRIRIRGYQFLLYIGTPTQTHTSYLDCIPMFEKTQGLWIISESGLCTSTTRYFETDETTV